MKTNLGIVICENFIEEFKYIITNSNMENIVVFPFLSKCKYAKNEMNDSLMESIKRCEEKCNKIIIIGGCCCTNLKKLIDNKANCKIYLLEHCFDLFTNKDIISHFINKNLYLVTPGMLKNSKKNSDALNFIKANKKIRLLDTGIYEGSLEKLKDRKSVV